MPSPINPNSVSEADPATGENIRGIGRAREWDRLTNDELATAYEGFMAAKEAMLGIYNRPRASGLGGEMIEREDTRLSELCEEIVAVLRRRGPRGDTREIERWAEVIVGWLIVQCGDDQSGLVALARETCAKAA